MNANQLIKSAILYIIFIVIYQIAQGQTYQNSYDKGFQIGFKEGVCYNKNSPCYVSLTPITPLLRINENINSYSDGYNRGFQVGLDLQRLEVEFDPNISSVEYNRFYNYYPKTFKSSDYVPSVDLSLLANVLRHKQAKFDANFDMFEGKFNKLRDLSYSIFKGRDNNYFNIISSEIETLVNEMNSISIDYSDDNLIIPYLNKIRDIEQQIYTKYSENGRK